MSKKGSKKNSNELQNRSLLAFRILSKVFNDIGFTGFCVIFAAILVLFYSDSDQKKEIINTWILFKSENNIAYAIVIILALVVLLIIQQVYYRGQIRLMNERIKAMAESKSQLQNILTNKTLSSSKKL